MKNIAFVSIATLLFTNLLFKTFAQQQIISPQSIRIENNLMIIDYQLKGTENQRFDIKKLQIKVNETGQIITGSTFEGDTKNIPPGLRQLRWDFKADNFFVDGDINIQIVMDQIGNISNDSPPKSIAPPTITYKPYSLTLKLGIAGTGALAAIGAFGLHRNFKSKADRLVELNKTLPQINGQLIKQSDLSTWNTAYSEAQAAKQKSGIATALIGVAGAAAILEVYLLVTKRKVKSNSFSLKYSPSTQGLALRYTF